MLMTCDDVKVQSNRLNYAALYSNLQQPNFYLLRKDTKIRIFNACVKSVLLYGCETWLVTNKIQRKIQTFVNKCLRYILRIWLAKYYFQQRSMESNRTRRYKFRNKKKKI